MKVAETCPNCNEEIQLIYADSYFACCQSCSSIISLKAARPEKAILGKNKKKGYPSRRYLAVGQSFNYQDVQYKITGRAVIKVHYELPQEKEHNKSSASYQEWFCRSESHDYLTITENAIGFSISRPEAPDQDVGEYLSGKFMRIYSDMNFVPIEETGEGKVLYFEGEADDNYYPGRKIKYATCKYNGYTYGAEWNPEKEEASMAFFVQNVMPELRMFKMIESENDLSEYNKKLKEYNFFRGSIIATTFLLLLMLFISVGYKGMAIYSNKIQLNDIPETGLKIEPFEIATLNSTYAVNVKSNLSASNTEVLVAVEINNENGNAIHLFEKWFWKAAGISEGERWTEEEIEESYLINPKKQGRFTPVVFKESTKLTKTSTEDSVDITINKGILLSRYFAALFIVFLVFIIFIYSPATTPYIKAWYFKILDK